MLAFPPYGWAWVTVPAVALFLLAVRRAVSAGSAVATGAGFGVAFFGLLFPWIAELGLVAFIPLLLLQASFPTLYAGLLHLARGWSVPAWMVAAIGGWAAMEWARERIPVVGFGWGLVGYPAGEYSATRHLAQAIGTTGWSVVIVAVASGLVAWGVTRRWRHAAGPAVAMGLAVLGGASMSAAPRGEPVSVAIVQGNTPCPGEHCPDERRVTFESHLALTQNLPPDTFDLVVWAESSTGFDADPVDNPPSAVAIRGLARTLGTTILLGADRAVGDAGFINANLVIGPGGELVGEYRKQHPVPFGEYIPARPVFEWIPALDQVPRDMVRGAGPVTFDTGFGPFGSVISFESSFSRFARGQVRDGSRLLVVATSQNSYPYSAASDQLIGMTRMRAAELGVDVVHAAVTGRSAIITGGGVVGERTTLAEPAILTGTVRMRSQGLTLYTRWGDWVQLAAIGMLIAAVVIQTGRVSPTRRAASDPTAANPLDPPSRWRRRGSRGRLHTGNDDRAATRARRPGSRNGGG